MPAGTVDDESFFAVHLHCQWLNRWAKHWVVMSVGAVSRRLLGAEVLSSFVSAPVSGPCKLQREVINRERSAPSSGLGG